MTDYRTLLRHAGLSDSEVERIAAQAEADDAAKASHREKGDDSLSEDGEDHDDQQLVWENGVEKLIRLIGRKTGVEPEGVHDVYIEGSACTVRLVHGHTYGLSQLMDFANKLASEGVGSDIKVGADADQRVILEFQLINRG